MEIIIAAGITAVVTLLAAGVYYNYKIKTIFENSKKALENQAELSKDQTREHNGLNREHDNILHKILMVNSDVKKAGAGVDAIIKDFLVEKNEQKHRYEALTEKQKDIVSSVDNIKSMSEELKRLAGENAELKRELQRERERNRERSQTRERTPDRGR